MAKIYAPNKEYTGISASIPFVMGKGETDNPHLIRWFKDHGYEVEEEKQEVASVEEMEPEALPEFVPEEESEPESLPDFVPDKESEPAKKPAPKKRGGK